MAKWTLSDGTTLRTGGKVEGHSALAADLRRRVQALRDGLTEWVATQAPPGGLRPMDLDDDLHLDVWLRGIAGAAGVAIDEAPEISHPTRTRTATQPGDID